jgi:hypothetical protein
MRTPSSTFGCRLAAHPYFSAGLLAGGRSGYEDTVGKKLLDITLRRGVLPHLAIHRRRNEQRTIARETQRREQIVTDAAGEFGEEIRGSRRNHDKTAVP